MSPSLKTFEKFWTDTHEYLPIYERIKYIYTHAYDFLNEYAYTQFRNMSTHTYHICF